MPFKVEKGIEEMGFSSDEKEGTPWKFEHTLVIIICVLGTILVVVVIYYCYLKCKKHVKRRNSRSDCSFHSCVCGQGRQPFGYGIVTTNGVPSGVYSPDVHGHSSDARRNWVHSSQHVNSFYDTQNENDTPLSYQIRYHSGHSDIQRQSQTLSRSAPVINPVYAESLNASEGEFNTQNLIDGPLKDLYHVTERSFTQTVCGKLLVSIAREVGYKGDVLFLDNMGISLIVPEGAVKSGDSKLIVLVLNWDLSDNPEMKKEESLVSPVVYIGPHGLKLEKPCTLIFRHCAFNRNQIRVMRSETELTSRKSWAALCDRKDSSGSCYLTPDECQLKIETFTLYTCVQTPLDDTIGKKWLQIAVFACPLRKEINHHQVRMYFLNKTNCALQWAIQNEANFGGKLICPEKVFLFDGNELDMFTETKYMSNGWELVDSQNSEKVSFIKIWHGQCPYISVCFRRSARQSPNVTSLAVEMSLHVFTFQRTLEENGEKIFIQVFEDDQTPFTKNEIRCNHQIEIQINNYNGGSCEATKLRSSDNSVASERLLALSGQDSSTTLSESCSSCEKLRNSDNVKLVINNQLSACSKADHCSAVLSNDAEPRLFPHSLRQSLILLLDPPKAPYGHDWKDLASKLGMDACIPKLQTHLNPTSELLDVLESQRKTYAEVISLFIEIGRMDCVEEMKKYFEIGVEQNGSCSREPTENTFTGHARGESHLRSEESSWTGSSHDNLDSWNSQFSSRKNTSETFSKDVSYSQN